ncbi:MAG: carbohydrate ABC transporter permease [Clostridiales bacterium]|nr:carbohydrate ABC transporter permease [Clostridiales bacterium]
MTERILQSGGGVCSPEKKRHKKINSLAFKIVAYIFLSLFLLCVLVPFYVILATSFTSFEEIMSTLDFIWWPDKISLEAYSSVLVNDRLAINGMSSLLRGFLNTMWQVLPTILGGLFVSGLAAYAYSKLRFKAKNILYVITLATMMIPGAALTMPTYLYYDALGWSHSVLPIMIPGLFGGAATIFFLRQFFAGIPTDLIEAGKLDGMGYLTMYVKIIIPLAVPAFLAQGIFAFVGGYNNYMGPMLYLIDNQMLWPLQLALGQLQAQYVGDQAIQCASAMIALVPLLIVYLVCQRFFIEGVAAAGLKG